MLAKGLLWTTVTLALTALPEGARAQGDQPTLLGTYADWGAYTATPGGKKVCFALSKPKSSTTNPAGRPRNPDFLSVIIGYPFKESTEATAEVGTAKFAMYTQKDGAWIKNMTEEARMLDAMRKGSDLTVKGTSTRGTSSTDQFSLKGLAQALERADQACK